MQDHVLVDVKGDRHPAEQRQAASPADLGDERLGGRRVDGLRLLARQAEHDGLDAAVAVAGGAERAEQLGPDTGDVIQPAVLVERGDKHEGCAHRPDRVRARRSYADLEEVEDADRHGSLPI